ncbi:ABSCISIC ACID-INSENSITIVE 5-like protein 2 [Rhodamnia argentea]|uniref:ABSCISIC ACID-INSENSITIVE 5-like protein 2 n=1 Tax=Rhodamnia argentea TaxID=178133 RepID=A0A8B8NCE5_9MYRT|nr:ABSCISIC ACID-INSENSITIVE 5-like protein 2 [Rhodamnia argentea]XP_030520112.2 ABSCISIC ACID-INSENSITIVE 5-like protein 2 [Rhodamnia argentea]XP_030520120.2 ABSCISIC ACID-INSENSITIVE 5-like protein 2 [Rhodamnia argentea]XP_048127822.1 ABSCISIC ACID-INSENSITIVE 5-like protein 2 [Rhodamnia argentea]XP_048127823.1 ABSCISIC ACID-INSENSITIVE 5-like protein 2 [Rhodamnia argentea]
MGSQGGGGSGAVQAAELRILARQGSLYGLTLDEVQNQLGHLGKPLGSMNLDELLQSVRSAEADLGPTSGAASVQPLSKDLCKKTVEELWKDIQQVNKKKKNDSENHLRNESVGEEERAPTFGEVTLEDFLLKAGVMAELPPVGQNGGLILGFDSALAPPPNVPQCIQWMQYHLPSIPQSENVMTGPTAGDHMVQPRIPIGTHPTMDAVYPDTQISMSPSALIGALSDVQSPVQNTVTPGDVVEKTVERRRKRMIKNRESAARSRARRQAYTHELEHKVMRLEEENARLRRQRDVEKMFPCEPPAEPKSKLRRTSSAPILTSHCI